MYFAVGIMVRYVTAMPALDLRFRRTTATEGFHPNTTEVENCDKT
jgi:hypothetical protein